MRNWVFIFGLCSGSILVFGQRLPDAGRVVREVRPERIEEQLLPPAIVDDDVPLPSPELSGATVFVRRFEIGGNTLVASEPLLALLREFEQRTANFAEIQGAIGRVTEFYRARGYLLARAYLPPQEIVDGKVRVQVVEGALEDLVIADNTSARLRDALVRSAMAPLLARGPRLKQRALERQLLRLNDLPGVRTLAVLDPGSSIGHVRLRLAVEEEPRFSAEWGVDNHGSRFTGEWRYFAAAHVSDPFGWGDRLDVQLLRSFADNVGSYGLHYQTGFPRHGLTWHARLHHVRYELEQEFAPLGADGTASTAELQLDWGLIRTQHHRVTLALGADYRQLDDRMRVVEVENERELAAAVFQIFGTLRSASGAGVSGFRAAARTGRLRLNTPYQHALDQSPAGLKTAGGFTRFEASAWHTQRFGAWSAHGFVTGQLAGRNLDSSEKTSLGGPQGVRAYHASDASADQALLARAELRYLAPLWPGRIRAQLNFFYEGGVAWLDRCPNPGVRDNRQVLHGGGFGATVQLPRGFQLDASLAWRGTEASRDNRDAGSPRFYLSFQHAL